VAANDGRLGTLGHRCGVGQGVVGYGEWDGRGGDIVPAGCCFVELPLLDEGRLGGVGEG
jgi:hypothetical protein